MTNLRDLFEIRRRFMRSVNLERDGDNPDGLEGYVLTPRTVDLMDRILDAYTTPNHTRAWTLTGVYGTGKSSFANFLSAAFARTNNAVRGVAKELLQDEGRSDIGQRVERAIPEEGLVRAVVTAKREPLHAAVLRALARGADKFWSHRPGRNPKVVDQLLRVSSPENEDDWDDCDLVQVTEEVAAASRSGVLLIIDELGKILEHAARTDGREDLYLLQQLAELPAGPKHSPVLVVGLLHQAFSEYGQLLSSAEQAEWSKIQGRFEDIPFAEPTDQMLRILGQAIEFQGDDEEKRAVDSCATRWASRIRADDVDEYLSQILSPARIAEILPLHPVAALVLPTLCARHGQNERSLFTFLASGEPHSLSRFLDETSVQDPEELPILGLADVYDYFVDVAHIGSTNRVQTSRWSEIHTVIRDAHGLPNEDLRILKAVGALNLVSSAGPLRASRELVLKALATRPDDDEERAGYTSRIDSLVKEGVLTYRTQIDELRVWQGSDFDIEGAVQERIEAERRSLGQVLAGLGASTPLVAQRHSYQTGTLRYFDRRFVDEETDLNNLVAKSPGSDGVMALWVGQNPPGQVPATTVEGLPVVLICSPSIQPLRSAALELSALLQVEKSEAALQADGVGRKELKKRIEVARSVLDRAMGKAFDQADERTVWARGRESKIANINGLLSDLLDETFDQGPILWNEIINRRNLTSQGAKAQRELITALLEAPEQPRLGIEGAGADYSIYASVLMASGIHREEEGQAFLQPPVDTDAVALRAVWDAIEDFCVSAADAPRSVDDLYELLQRPPYGVAEGLIPVLLAPVLLYRSEDVSVYQEGSFVPVLTPAHFELLVKKPEKFSVKYFDLGGVRFGEYRRVLQQTGLADGERLSGVRNETLLNVVRPLIQFAVSLPEVTKNTKSVSDHAVQVRRALLNSREPDELIFSALPKACAFEPFRPGEARSKQRRRRFLDALAEALRELRFHYEDLLGQCEELVHHAFGVKSGLTKLREHLRVRAQYLMGSVIEPQLNSFVVAAVDEVASDREWLESIVMIVADRPAKNWSDDDITSFEINLGEVVRRFKNLEALRSEISARPEDGFDARRVAITSVTGHQTARVIWMEQEADQKIREKADKLLAKLDDDISDSHLREAILVRMLEKALGHADRSEQEKNVVEKGEKKHA